MDTEASPTKTLLTEFLPSRDGFAFGNIWEDEPFSIKLGDSTFEIGLKGRCGGMSFAALDYHRVGIPAHDLASDVPEAGSDLARYILWRQIESIVVAGGANMLRFVSWTYRPARGLLGAAELTRDRELGNLLVSMVAGRPVPLGLIFAERFRGWGLNHQVVAWGVDKRADSLSIRIYDPNYPGRDDVTLELTWDGDELIEEHVAGKPRRNWRGLFVEEYKPRSVTGYSPKRV